MRKWSSISAVAVLLLAACGGNKPASVSSSTSAQELIASVASYDLGARAETRFTVGLLTGDNRFVSFGQVQLRFSFLGVDQAEGTPEPGPEATAEFLLVPGQSVALPQTGPKAVTASEGRGVYAAKVTFAKRGVWQVEATAVIQGDRKRTATALFQVLEKHKVPAPGDPALPTVNLTPASTDAPKAAVDSRAGAGGEIPDPELHRTTIAEALRRKRPALVVFATPVYCVSRFCGPVTDMVGELAKAYPDRADYIHIEIWRDYQQQTLNRAAAEWLLRDNDLNEPWVFLIGADGKIAARWDNVSTPGEIEPLLRALPPLPPGG